MAAGSGGAPRNDSAPAMFGLGHASGRRYWSLLVFEPCGLRCQLDLERRTVAPAHVGNRELIMLLRNWFSTCVAVGFMSLAPHIASAKEVPATAQPDAAANSLPEACFGFRISDPKRMPRLPERGRCEGQRSAVRLIPDSLGMPSSIPAS